MEKRKIAEIMVSGRHRKNMANLQKLADSIQAVGLLHPIVIKPDNTLIVGERRLEAIKLLNREEIPVNVAHNLDDLLLLLRAEADENTCREPFTPEEAVAHAESYRAIAEAQVKEAVEEGNIKGGGDRKSEEYRSRISYPRAIDEKPKQDETKRTNAILAQAVGLSRSTLEKAQVIVEAAKAEPEKYAPLLEKINKTGKVDGAYKELNRKRKEESTFCAAKELLIQSKNGLDNVCDIRHCSMEQLLSGETMPDCIITDPPYSKEYLGLYEELARLSVDVPLVAVMCGQSYLPEILGLMCKHLEYRWTLAYLTPGGQSVQLWQAKVNTFWKPVLIFGKSERWIGDVIRSDVNDNDKRFHEWGQSESGMADLVERLTLPGQLVCDPFGGAFTTCLVSLKLGRRFVGCDLDEKCVIAGRDRCGRWINGKNS